MQAIQFNILYLSCQHSLLTGIQCRDVTIGEGLFSRPLLFSLQTTVLFSSWQGFLIFGIYLANMQQDGANLSLQGADLLCLKLR